MIIKFFASCLVLIASYITVIAQSDSKLYIKAYGGYGIFTPGSYKLESRTTYTYQVSGANRDTSIISFGKKGMGGGLRLGGGLGFIVNNFINIGVDAEYLKGVTLENSNKTDSSLKTLTLSYNVVTITPQIVFKAISYSDFYIYNKLGILISLPFEIGYSEYDSLMRKTKRWQVPNPDRTGSLDSKIVRYATAQHKIPVSFGLNVALGCQFIISDNLRGFVEGFANFMVLSPTSYHREELYNLREEWTETQTLNGKKEQSFWNETNNYTFDDTYTKNGGLTVQSTSRDESPSPRQVKENGVTTNTIKYVNSLNKTLPKFSRNMNAMGINIGLAYRF